MDVIIRNGKIQEGEAERIEEIKNEEGLLKKDYKNYLKGVPGPYYDLHNCHLCVPRKFNDIKNFFGPQISNQKKIIYTKNFDRKVSYCCICHKMMKPNTAFSAKRKIFIEDDIFERKIDKDGIDKSKIEMINLENSMKKFKLDSSNEKTEKTEKEIEYIMSNLNIDNITGGQYKSNYKSNDNFNNNINNDNVKNNLTNQIKKPSSYKANIFRWRLLNLKIKKNNTANIYYKYKLNQSKMIKLFYILSYKLLYEPIYYPISTTQTKLLYPWELTNYQKFKIDNPDYKNNPIFSHANRNRITENYVIIE